MNHTVLGRAAKKQKQEQGTSESSRQQQSPLAEDVAECVTQSVNDFTQEGTACNVDSFEDCGYVLRDVVQ